jgi:hypothetical protein
MFLFPTGLVLVLGALPEPLIVAGASPQDSAQNEAGCQTDQGDGARGRDELGIGETQNLVRVHGSSLTSDFNRKLTSDFND